MSVLARLPELTGDELDELHLAIADRAASLERVLEIAQAPAIHSALGERVAILRSLDTAVLEARSSIRVEVE